MGIFTIDSSLRFSCFVCILCFNDLLILALGSEPQQEGNEQRWQSHDEEYQPIKDMGRELPLEVFERNYVSFSWFAGQTELHLTWSFCLVHHRTRSEVESSPNTGLWTVHHCVGHIRTCAESRNGESRDTTLDIEVVLMQTHIIHGYIDGRTVGEKESLYLD